MADMDNNSAITAVTSHVEMNGSPVEVVHMDDSIVDDVGVGVTDEEILQNALVDANNGCFSTVQIQYEESDELNPGSLINNGVQFINEGGNTQANSDQLADGFVGDSSEEFMNDADFVNQTVTERTELITAAAYQTANKHNGRVSTVQERPVLTTHVLGNSGGQQPQVTVQGQTSQVAPALGSSQNPIRIIQQGNQYTPVQQLSTDQLQQIMQVVQQQQVNKNVATGSSVLFNPQTNTRIVYRVIYPSQLHKDDAGNATKMAGQQTVMSYIPKKVYKKRAQEDDNDRIDGPELSKEEKEKRKRMRPKTRSGRVSKPPQHMVKDFKHIHVLDYDEDYDDSDGGYSDFKCEGEEDSDRKVNENYISYVGGVDSMKNKKWKCITCEKAYIGRAGLARHLRLNPSHGNIDPDGDGDMEPPDPNTPVSLEDTVTFTPATPNSVNSTANSTASFSEDSRDSSISLTYTPTPRARGRGRGRPGRGSWRGRGAYSKTDPETRRLNKLKEITRECSDEELMEIVLPRLAKVITLWEFLLMKVEKGNPAWPHADDIYKEYLKIHEHVKKLCQEYLQFVGEPEDSKDQQQQALLQVENSDVAQALGLKVGHHKVRDIADTDTDIQYKYKFLTTNQSVDFDYTNKSFLKRTVEVVSPEQIVSPAKKFKQVQARPVTSPQKNLNNSNANRAFASVTVANNAPSSSTPVSSVPLKAKIKVISPQRMMNGKVSQCSNSGKPISGKTVSLLSNSSLMSKLSSSSNSSLSSLSSSSSSEKSSQKVIIVSGTNSTPQSSASAFINNTEQVVTNIAATCEGQSMNQLTDEAGGRVITIPDGRGFNTQDGFLLHDSATGTYTVVRSMSGNVTNTSQAAADLTPISSNEPVIVNIPPSSTQQIVQPKVVLNDMNLLNSVPSDTGEYHQIISNVTGENIVNRQVVRIKSEEGGVSDSVPAEGIDVVNIDPGDQNLILTLQNGNPVRVSSGYRDGENVLYALTNGVSSQEDVVYTVDPNSMLVTQHNGDQSNVAANGVQNLNSHEIIQTNGENEVVGVINSIDNSEEVDVKWEVVESVSPNEDLQVNGNALINDAPLNEEQAHMAAMSEDKLNIIGPKVVGVGDNELDKSSETVVQEESIQIPATSIFQTEDGTILIQNPDGTTLQLQGSDGQAVSMETVQALLGMVTENSVTEDNVT